MQKINCQACSRSGFHQLNIMCWNIDTTSTCLESALSTHEVFQNADKLWWAPAKKYAPIINVRIKTLPPAPPFDSSTVSHLGSLWEPFRIAPKSKLFLLYSVTRARKVLPVLPVSGGGIEAGRTDTLWDAVVVFVFGGAVGNLMVLCSRDDHRTLMIWECSQLNSSLLKVLELTDTVPGRKDQMSRIYAQIENNRTVAYDWASNLFFIRT